MLDLLDYVEVKTSAQPDACLIWLHGLGADGHDFENLVDQLHLPEQLGVRFLFPHAPIQPVSINAGYPMRSWFDVLGLDDKSIQDEAGIRKSQKRVEALIDHVINEGIASKRIILGGFSQGGALALHIAIRYSQQLAGVAALSTYLPLADLTSKEKHQANDRLPIFIAHGSLDPIVPYRFGQISYDMLKELQFPVVWHHYPIAHSVCEQEVKDISQWIQQVLKND